MKKFLPYILILVIIANIFAPFSVAINKNGGVSVEQNKIEAALVDPLDEAMRIEAKKECLETTPDDPKREFCLKGRWAGTGEKGKVVIYTIGINHTGKDTYYVAINIKDEQGILVKNLTTTTGSSSINEQDVSSDQSIPATYAGADQNIVWDGRLFTSENITLEQNKNYTLSITIQKSSVDGVVGTESKTVPIKIGGSTSTSTASVSTTGTAATENELLPTCVSWTRGVDVLGCIGYVLYYAVFKTSAFFFGLAGKFFDWAFAYSIMDTSYRSTFVTEGWGIIRDTCNLFFIFVLIYAAFGMILSIHSIKAKEIIINTVIIGLLINFSLFAGQVLIDTSNILARVFYNSDAIKITTSGPGGVIRSAVDTTSSTEIGELSISAALVEKVDPQKLILQASKVQVIDNNTTDGSGTNREDGISGGTFLLVVIMASAVNIVGLIVFLSVGLIFVARVIGLWFALIFAPLAFFSYTVPQMQNIKMIGWKKWWPDIMGLCFVAPIFMFFMYLILLFLEKGFAGIIADQTGANWVLSVMIPFIFIMMLLLMAKKLAKDYSGEMGQMITGAVTAAGGMALGGAALTTAFVGRQTMGRFSKAIINDSASQKAFRDRNDPNATAAERAAWGNMGGWQKFKGRVGSKIVKHEKDVGEKSHSEHVLNEKAQAVTGRKDAAYKDLNADSKKDVRDAIDRDLVSKEMFGKTYDRLKAGERTSVEASKTLNGNSWKDAAEFARANAAIENRVLHTADHMDHSSKYGKGLVDGTKAGIKQLGSQSRTGSYDVRNLSQMNALPSSWLSKFGVGLIAGVAMGVRTALKSGVDLEHGKGQKDLLKDLAHTVSESIKHSSSKIASAIKDVSSAGHGDGGHDDHGGGHGGGGGGHH